MAYMDMAYIVMAYVVIGNEADHLNADHYMLGKIYMAIYTGHNFVMNISWKPKTKMPRADRYFKL